MTFLVDSHCHLSSLSYSREYCNSFAVMLKRAYLCKVSHFLCVACSLGEFKKNLAMMQEYDNIYLSCGIHPLNLNDEEEVLDEHFISLCTSSNKVIAVGETGLDYFYSKQTRELQKKSFVRQIHIAVQAKLPLIIHAREAQTDTLEILRGENARDIGGVVHCFTDSVDMARALLDLGFYISFTGIATFKASDNVREVLRYVPKDRFMVETDCPYLAPVPVRGIENEPAFVRYTLKFIAEYLGMSEDELARITSANFENIYGVKLAQPLGCCVDSSASEISLYKIDKIAGRPFSL